MVCDKIIRIILSLTIILLLAKPTASLAATQEFLLENGLKIIVREEHFSPLVMAQVWYKVGSSYEHHGITGISHTLHHIIYKGFEKHPGKNDMLKIIKEGGTTPSAITGFDHTFYYQHVLPSELENIFQIEAQKMQNLVISENELAIEKKMILQERLLQIDEIPTAIAKERFYTAAFPASPYQHPVIGWKDDICNLTLSQIQKWHKNWYSPNNTVIVIVGNIRADEAFNLAKEYFGNLQPGRNTSLLINNKHNIPSSFGTRKVDVVLPTKSSYLYLGYNVPSITTAEELYEPYALQVLANIIGEGRSSRLAKDLSINSYLSDNINVFYDPYRLHATLLTISCRPTHIDNLHTIEEAIIKQIETLSNTLVSEQELTRAKNKIIANKIYFQDSLFLQAYEIGRLEAINVSWHMAENFINNIMLVTSEQIRNVAKKYLTTNHLTITRLIPEGQHHAAHNQIQKY